jgi:endonuclease G
MRRHLSVWALMIAVMAGLLWIGGASSEAPRKGKTPKVPDVPADLPPRTIHLAMGNPSGATDDPAKKDNFLMVKDLFTLSYNNSKGSPNWVSWHLSSAYLGNAPRKPRFDPDTTLPAGFERITHNDYAGTGFDRGHMCPHSDRNLNTPMSYKTFVMTNVVPQSHENNAGAWEALETYSRFLAEKKAKDLFIVAGPVGQGGQGKDGPADAIANGKVVVPEKTWKVIMVVDRLEREEDPLKWVNQDVRLIAVMVPNNTATDHETWGQYRCSVETVERATGYQFFTNADPKVINPLKKKVDQTTITKLPHPQ